MSSNKEIMVTCFCLCFNYEKYIAQCLDGMLNQITNFNYEILILDDASTDNSQTIIKQYQKKYPDKIKTILHKKNEGKTASSLNPNELLPLIRGKYIATCDGDDYWNNPNKLQKQFESLKNHKNCSICVHDVKILNYSQTMNNNELYTQYNSSQIIYGNELIESLILQKVFFQTSSFFLTTKIVTEYIKDRKIFNHWTMVEDRPLLLYICSKSNIYYINKPHSTYRYQTDNSWSYNYNNNDFSISFLKQSIKSYKAFNKYTHYKFNKPIKKYIYKSSKNIEQDTIDFIINNNFDKKIYKKNKLYLKYLNPEFKLYLVLNVYFPKIAKMASKLNKERNARRINDK